MTEAQQTALVVRLYTQQDKVSDRLPYSPEIRAMANAYHHYETQSDQDPDPVRRYEIEGIIHDLLISLRKKGFLAPKTQRRAKRKVTPTQPEGADVNH